MNLTTILSILTESTCGEACWEAKEDVCRCSCNGANHGCLRVEGGIRPLRTAKIDGHRYELKAVDEDNNLYMAAASVNAQFGCKDIQIAGETRWHYTWRAQDVGAPARLKLASKEQKEKWTELAPFKSSPSYATIAMLWIRVDPPRENYCPDVCARCEQIKRGFKELTLDT